MPQKYEIHLEFLPDITNHSRSNYVIVMDMGNVHHNISCLKLEDNFLTEFFKLEHIEIMMQKLTAAGLVGTALASGDVNSVREVLKKKNLEKRFF